jgi:hypothetical protein
MSFLAFSTLVAAASVIASALQSPNLPFSAVSVILTYICAVLGYSIWAIVLAPHFSPFRKLPSPEQGPWYKRFPVEPDPGGIERWINEIPNDGLIRYFGAFNRESLLTTRPDVVNEFLQTKVYKFNKMQVGKNYH